MMNANYHAFSRGQGTRPEYNELADLEDKLHQWTAFYHLPAPLRKALGRCLHKINEGTDYNGLFALTLETFPLGTEHMWRQLKKQRVYPQSFKEAFPNGRPPRRS